MKVKNKFRDKQKEKGVRYIANRSCLQWILIPDEKRVIIEGYLKPTLTKHGYRFDEINMSLACLIHPFLLRKIDEGRWFWLRIRGNRRLFKVNWGKDRRSKVLITDIVEE